MYIASVDGALLAKRIKKKDSFAHGLMINKEDEEIYMEGRHVK